MGIKELTKKHMAIKKIFIFTTVIIASFSLFISAFAKEPTFTTLEGEAIKYQDLIAAPKAVLMVWTTECYVCRDAIERLAAESIFLDDVAIYFIDTGEHPMKVKRFADSLKLNTSFRKKIILDKEYFVADTFSVNAVPTYIFFRDKKPVYRSFYLDSALIQSVFGK